MFFKKKSESKEEVEEKIELLKSELKGCDSVVIGSGAGLSTSAGFTYSGERFEKYFSDFGQKYGFSDMYSGGFYPYGTLEEFWAYWSRYIMINRYMDAPKNVYENLLCLVKDKDYFVITTNVDHCFQKARFDKTRLFYTQGDYGLFQCSVPCHQMTYDNEENVKAMYEAQKDMKIPTELIPHCPICHKPMSMNLRADGTFVQDKGWYEAAKRYEDFLDSHSKSHTLFLELGVGANTPGIIKYPFWNLVLKNKNALYACINYGEAVAPDNIKGRSICINEDIGSFLERLLKL